MLLHTKTLFKAELNDITLSECFSALQKQKRKGILKNEILRVNVGEVVSGEEGALWDAFRGG
uniref:hypothetical protein n=1 Tax=Bartonella heixiaziensis TaxID=1461000 RepID=UPI003908A308